VNRKVIKAYFDYEKEEKWLNQMVSKGWALKSYSFLLYTFEPCEPNEFVYRIELLSNTVSHPESIKYIEFAKELNVEYITSYFSWAYFRKKASDGPFEIHSDATSKLKHIKRIMTFQGMLGISNFLLGISNLGMGLTNHFSLYIGGINMLIAIILGYLCYKNYHRINKLKEEILVHE